MTSYVRRVSATVVTSKPLSTRPRLANSQREIFSSTNAEFSVLFAIAPCATADLPTNREAEVSAPYRVGN